MLNFNQNVTTQIDSVKKVKLISVEALFGGYLETAFKIESGEPQKIALIKQRQSRAKRRNMRRAAFGF